MNGHIDVDILKNIQPVPINHNNVQLVLESQI